MERITSIDDPRIAAYRHLRDRTLRGESLFVAEGELLSIRLLASHFQVESVFVSDQLLDRVASRVPEGTPIYVGPERLLREVVGFNFHRGVLAVGRRGTRTTLDELLVQVDRGGRLSLVVCPDTTNPENLGLIFRSAAALDIDGVLLGERCCDPLSRRCLRLSMGGSLQVPTARSANLAADLRELKGRYGVELLAAVADQGAEPLTGLRWPQRVGILFGNEFDGLGPHWLAECDRCVTIPMRPGADSLNLGVAASIFFYERAQPWSFLPSS
jgi:tRNA G18 (ribose-2'-O)-methylase SpoU